MTPRTFWDSGDGLWELSPDGEFVRWISHVVFGDVANNDWLPFWSVSGDPKYGPLVASC